jgi:hypothetical protein
MRHPIVKAACIVDEFVCRMKIGQLIGGINFMSAMVYYELLKNYTLKGDTEKAKEMESKLKEAGKYADKGMYQGK